MNMNYKNEKKKIKRIKYKNRYRISHSNKVLYANLINFIKDLETRRKYQSTIFIEI